MERWHYADINYITCENQSEISNMEIWDILISNIYYLSCCYCRDILIYTEFLAKSTDECADFRFFCSIPFLISDPENCFLVRLPVVTTLYFLRNLDVYRDEDIVDEIRKIQNFSLSKMIPSFYFILLFCTWNRKWLPPLWFINSNRSKWDVKLLLSISLQKLFFFVHINHNSTDCCGLRNAVEKHIFVYQLKNVIVNDDYRALIKFIETVKLESEHKHRTTKADTQKTVHIRCKSI